MRAGDPVEPAGAVLGDHSVAVSEGRIVAVLLPPAGERFERASTCVWTGTR